MPRTTPLQSALFCAGVLFASLSPYSFADEADIDAANVTLNQLHQNAIHADWDSYFALYRQDAVFIGTDAGERWSMTEFARYARPTKGWQYIPKDRKLIQHGKVILFDELLDSPAYGLSRGTGTLLKNGEHWQIAQYHLSFPIPNELAKSITAQIKAASK